MHRKLTEETIEEVRNALASWHTVEPKGLLSDWLVVKQQQKQLGQIESETAGKRLATNQALLNALDQLAKQSPKQAKTIRLRSLDQEVEQGAAQELGVSVSSMYRYQRKAIKALTQILVAQEQTLYAQSVANQMNVLPKAQYTHLFGIADKQNTLIQELTSTESLNFHLVCGLGGIGKTSLIRSVVEQLIKQLAFEHVIWIEIVHHTMQAQGESNAVKQIIDHLAILCPSPNPSEQQVKQWFRQQSALLIIDNIEELHDATAVYRYFNQWAVASKIVLTSRARPVNLQQVHVTLLDEISRDDSYAMMRHVAKTSGQVDLAQASSDQLRPIYGRTGGNPQAIKIVLGLASTRPLQIILDDLPQAEQVETEELYHHIYWRAWRSLSEKAKKLFEIMPLAGSRGTTPEHMQYVSKLIESDFWAAVEELMTRSLLLQSGTTFKPRYRIHRLSDQFLQKQVLKW